MDFSALFVDVDDFWKQFRPAYEQRLLADGQRRPVTRQTQIETEYVVGAVLTGQLPGPFSIHASVQLRPRDETSRAFYPEVLEQPLIYVRWQ